MAEGTYERDTLGVLAGRIASGDVAAFEAVYRELFPLLVTYGARLLGDVARAEEVVQELFFDFWTHRAEWARSGSLRPYLYKALHHRALNVLRRDRRHSVWEEEVIALPDLAAALPAEVWPPDKVLETSEWNTRVGNAVHALPARCRVVMRLRWYEGMSYAEIAAVMGISEKGVENQLSRGLKALRALLQPRAHGGER